MLVARSPNFIETAQNEAPRQDNASYALRAALAWRLIARPATESPAAAVAVSPAPTTLPAIAA